MMNISLEDFDNWLLYNSDYTQEERENIIDALINYHQATHCSCNDCRQEPPYTLTK